MFVPVIACSGPDANFTASATEGNAPFEVTFAPAVMSDDATYTWDFGDGNGSNEPAPTHVFESAGDFTTRLTIEVDGRSSYTELPVKVAPGAAGWVVVSTEKTELVAGESIQLAAEAFDSLGNPVTDAEIDWQADPEVGAVTAEGVFTAAAVSGSFGQAVTARFERLDAVGTGDLSVSIRPGPIAAIQIEPSELDLIVGQRLPLTARATDSLGTPITEARISFSAVRSGDTATTGGELTVGSQVTGGRAELVEVTATLGADSYSQTFLGTVRPSVLDEVVVTPRTVELGVNDQVTLDSRGLDRFGNAVRLDDVEYSLLDEGVGEITQSGVFTASNRATSLRDSLIVVKGWSNGVWRKTEVPLRVIPGPVASLEIVPADDSVPMGAGSPMRAIARDEFGNEVPGAPVQWVADAGGTVTNDGTFIAGLEAGEFADAVRATVPAGAAGNSEPVGATTTISVRPRSADMMAADINGDQDSDIALIDLRTSSIRVLNDLPGDGSANEAGASWYPDGSKLVFSSDATGTFQVYEYDLEGGQVRQLTDDPDGALMPSISPDGTQLAYVSTRNDRFWQIFVATLPADTGEGHEVYVTPETANKISADDSMQNLLPVWSPDGTHIAYTSSRSVSDNDIRIVAADGTGETEVISGPGYVALGWDPSGDSVRATITGGDLTGVLVTIDVASAEVTEAVPIPIRAFSAAWSPDGSEVAVVNRFTGEMWLADTDGTGLRVTLSGTLATSRISWRPVPITGPGS